MYPVLEKQFELRLHPENEGTIRQKGTNSHASLNAIATEILEMCDGKTSFETMCQILAKKHDDTVERVKDITFKFLQQAQERKYVSFHEQPVNEHGLVVGSRDYFSPSHVGIELTYRCNLKCKHCYADASSAKAELSTSDALKILETLHTAGVASVMFSGGEPTLHPGLFPLLDFSSSRFERLQLFSNGWNIDEMFAEKLAKYRHKLMVQISLDGKNSKTHDYIRGRKGSFERACNAITVLSKDQIYTVVAMLVTPFNLDQIEEVFLCAKHLGAREFRLGRVTPLGRGKGVDWELTDKEFKEAGTALNKLSKKYGKEVSVESWEDLITGEHPNVTEKENGKDFGNNCGAGHRLANVTPNGDVLPCALFSEEKFILGNLLSQDLKTVFGSSMNWFFYRINIPSVKSCGICDHFYKCKGCLIRGYSMHKKLKECPWAKQEIVDIPRKESE